MEVMKNVSLAPQQKHRAGNAINPWFNPLAIIAVLCTLAFSTAANAVTTTFFNSSQVATIVASGTSFDTLSSNGYLFTYTRDKLFTGGYGMTTPIGRPVSVAWPNGVQAQAVTVGPKAGPAQITIKRVDGNVFDISAFSAKLLANTAGAGASFEVMPKLNGEDGLPNPVFFNATGYGGQTFSYNNSANYFGSTAALTGFDSYTFSLYVDFALTSLTLVDASAPVPDTAPPAITPVPEPETYAMMLVGLALLVLTTRRRR